MKTDQELKEIVRKKYSEIAEQDVALNKSSCCGAGPVSQEVYNIMTDDYSETEGYQADADLGLGCGLPTHFAHIEKGDTVLDLGSGAGNDVFVARHEIGPEGKVIGVDFSGPMIRKARLNADKLGYNNVEFREGDIEELPILENSIDVVVSNCVLNLVPNKAAVFNEIHRVLKPGAHFSISDVVLQGELPDALQKDAEMYAGCVSGAIQKDAYLEMARKAGFKDLQVQKEKPIYIPADILSQYLTAEEMKKFGQGEQGIYSITLYGQKEGEPKKEKKILQLSDLQSSEACTPGGGCC